MPIPRTPPSLPEILRDQPRACLDAIEGGQYQVFAQRANEKYWHWDKVRIIARSAGLDPKIAWAVIAMGRQPQFRETTLVGESERPIKFGLTNSIQRNLMLIDQQLAGLIASPVEELISSTQRERYLLNSFSEEAIASSMLEGAATTRRDAKRMIQKDRKPRSTGEQMVFNNYQAMLFIREHRHTDLSPEFIFEIHRLLTNHTMPTGQIGRYRKDADKVVVADQYGEVMHTPPLASELPNRIARFCTFANQIEEQDDFIHPVVKACLLHFQFGFDHPFCDGNGRTARALFYWYTLKRNYWLFEFMPISRLIYRSPGKYKKAFLYAETDDFDVTYFLHYHLDIISRTRTDMIKYLERQQQKAKNAQSLFQSNTSHNARQREIMQQALQHPHTVFTVKICQNRFAIAYATARADLLALADQGYLIKSIEGKRFEFVRGPRLNEFTSVQ